MKKKCIYVIVISLIIVSFVSFCRIAGNDFINLDDDTYITKNNYIKSGLNLESLKWLLTTTDLGYWHPLTLLSHVLVWSIFEANTSAHHLVNLLFHIVAVIFLFLFLHKTTNNTWSSAFAAAFFAIHPLRVESVAWVAERKDVLSMFWGMACIYAYSFYVENRSISKYLLCLALFALGLMSKPTMVTLPFAMMLLDYWPLGRWKKVMGNSLLNKFKIFGNLLWEKFPFFFLSFVASIASYCMQHKINLIISLDYLPFSTRIANSIISYVVYLWKILWPFNLSLFYTYNFHLPLWKILISIIVLMAITFVVVYRIKKNPFLFVGWFWFLGTLVPVIGLVQFCLFARTDRYTYLPSIGISVMLVWGFSYLIKQDNIRKFFLFPIGMAILFIMAIMTWQQCGYWKNSVEIWNHALRVTKNNYFAHEFLALSLTEEGKIYEALDHHNEAVRLKPYCPEVYNNRGIAFARIGLYHKAIDDFSQAINLKPDLAKAYFQRGNAYDDLGMYHLAVEDFNETIRLQPNFVASYNNRGIVYFKQGKEELGCRDVQKACELGMCSLLEFVRNKGYCR